jgi:hypothetical protein
MKGMAPLVCEKIHEALSRSVGILSLTEVPDDPIMWAHYAESHRGILVGFDEKHVFFNRRRSGNDECYFLRKVVYADVPPAPSIPALEVNAIFATKGTKWAYEREWRMLAPLRDSSRRLEVAGDAVYLYSFPSSALTSIVIGAWAAASTEDSVRNILSTDARLRHVAVSRAVLDHETQRVNVHCSTM